MNTAVINIKVDPKTKKEAQRIAKDLGFSVSSLINGYLRQLVKTKKVSFSVKPEVPSAWLIKSLKKSEADIKAGRVSPGFTNADDAIGWLKAPKRKYANQIR